MSINYLSERKNHFFQKVSVESRQVLNLLCRSRGQAGHKAKGSGPVGGSNVHIGLSVLFKLGKTTKPKSVLSWCPIDVGLPILVKGVGRHVVFVELLERGPSILIESDQDKNEIKCSQGGILKESTNFQLRGQGTSSSLYFTFGLHVPLPARSMLCFTTCGAPYRRCPSAIMLRSYGWVLCTSFKVTSEVAENANCLAS